METVRSTQKDEINEITNMKRKIIFSVLAMLLALGAYADPELNIYASGLRVSQENGVTKVSYVLNAPATSLNVKLYDEDENLVATIPITGSSNLTKGAHSNVVIDLTSVAIPSGTYDWAMEASAAANNSTTKVSVPVGATHAYTTPRGLDVDKDPSSPSFGNVYVADSKNGAQSAPYGDVHYYPASLLSCTEISTSGWSASPASPMRITIGEDHLLYISDWSDNSPNIHIVDPEGKAVETLVFDNSKQGSNGICYASDGTTQMHGSISHCYVTGTGSSRVLYTCDEDMAAATGSKGVYYYDIKNLASAWSSKWTDKLYSNPNSYLSSNGNFQIYPDGKEGWWISQHSDNNTSNPVLIHLNSTGTANFTTSSLSFGINNRAAFGLNLDKTKIAVSRSSSGVSAIDIWIVSWTEEVPSLVLDYSITTKNSADASCYNVAFDYAGNLYATYNSGDLYVYAPVKANNTCETPAKVEDNDKIVVSNPHICAYGLDVDATETGYTFSFTANMAAVSGAIEFYDATTGAKVGEVEITESIVKGDNEITIPITSLPGTFGQEMTWKVRLTGEDNDSFSLLYDDSSNSTNGRAHLAVDANPESNYFGNIYYSNRTKSNSLQSGIYVYSPDFTRSSLYQPVGAITGGIMRIAIAADGKVWGMDWSDAHSGVFIINPANLNTSSEFFQGTRNSEGLITNDSDEEIGGSGSGIFIEERGANTYLYTTQEDLAGHGSNPLAVYQIDNEETWDTPPTNVFTINNGNGNNSIFVVKEGIWIVQRREGNSTADPALQFINKTTGALIKNFGDDARISGCPAAGMTVDTIHNKLYIGDLTGNILIFDISYAPGTNMPTLTAAGSYSVGLKYITSLALDYAGNLYATAGSGYSTTDDSSSQHMMVFSPATDDNTTTVPAKKSLTVTKVSHSREVDNIGEWGTVCLPYGVTAENRSGATFYSIAGKRTNNNAIDGTPVSVVLSEVENAELVKGTPYIFQSTETNVYLLYNNEDAAAAAGSDNGLIGKFVRFPFENNISVDDIENTYILTATKIQRASIKSGIVAYRAYIYMSEVPLYNPSQQVPGRIIELPLSPQNTTDADVTNADSNTITKIFRDGRVLILRDGKCYDVVGRIVK